MVILGYMIEVERFATGNKEGVVQHAAEDECCSEAELGGANTASVSSSG